MNSNKFNIETITYSIILLHYTDQTIIVVFLNNIDTEYYLKMF